MNRVVKELRPEKEHKAGTEEEEEGSKQGVSRGVQRPQGSSQLEEVTGETQGCETQEAQSLVGTGQGHTVLEFSFASKLCILNKGDILLNQGPAFRGSKTHLHRPTPVPNPWLTRLIKSEAHYCSHITIPNT